VHCGAEGLFFLFPAYVDHAFRVLRSGTSELAVSDGWQRTEFFHGVEMPKGFSTTITSLIPKTASQACWSEYRPIGICNVTNKICTKLITIRLGRVLPKKANVVFTLDMAKAYDRVSWGFLYQVLRQKGFLKRWIGLVANAVTYCWFLVLVYGEHAGLFPLDPRLKTRNMELLHDFLRAYRWVSGQLIDGMKSSFIVGQVSSLQMQAVQFVLGYQLKHLPVTYLGLGNDESIPWREAGLDSECVVGNFVASASGMLSTDRRWIGCSESCRLCSGLFHEAVVAVSKQVVLTIPIAVGQGDKIVWMGSSKGDFSTKSAWEAIRQTLPRRQLLANVWHCSLWPTISVFLWRLFQDTIPVDANGSSFRNPSLAGAACIIRDSAGLVHLAYQVALGIRTSVIVELTAVWRGLELVLAHGLAPLVVEVDVTTVIKILQSCVSGKW
ncbi:hypothetical protein Sango_2913600, partial [Sesamum angolense]